MTERGWGAKLCSLSVFIMKFLSRQLDLQAKISLVLVCVILPTFLIVTVAQNKLTQPILEEEVRQMGIHFGKTIAAEIDGSRLLSSSNASQVIENLLQEQLYSQPDIVRVDVIAKDALTGEIKLIASNIEEEPGAPLPVLSLVETVTSEYKTEETGEGFWELHVPIEHRSRDARSKKLLGMVHLVVSTKLEGRIVSALWKTTAMAATFSVISLIGVLSYFLRKTIANDRLLKKAESVNLKLTEQLHDAQRQLMVTEKLAVMGQLTASFAHEIGTPLTAIGGHLQLLKDEIPSPERETVEPRLEIVNGQLAKIEGIVKGFLQSTAKPSSQRQLVDLNRLLGQTVGIVMPRMDALGIEIKRKLDHHLAPVRAVPLDIEQILLNLLNNSIDSIQAKMRMRDRGRFYLEVVSEMMKIEGKQWARIMVYDTGEGIRKVDLHKVLKPFFTTKRPGEGTGLGLTICQELAHKYGGELFIDSKEGAWTRVILQLPYHATV